MDKKIILCAPMQGFTDSIWRNAHYRIFGGVDAYYTPFARIEHNEILKRDIRDIDPSNNSAPIIPQIIACKAEDAVKMAKKIKEMGYNEIDINLGCPFPPIALHHKGSGMLSYPSEIKNLMEQLSEVDDVNYSVKMRLGWNNPEQWKDALAIINEYNVTQVTIHPRIGRQQYKGDLLLDQIADFIDASNAPVIFNGGITSATDIDSIEQRWPKLKGVMLGHGLISNPALLSKRELSAESIEEFHNELLAGYSQRLNGGEAQLIKKMQNLWEEMLPKADHKAHKLIRKANTLPKYEQAVGALLNSLKI